MWRGAPGHEDVRRARLGHLRGRPGMANVGGHRDLARRPAGLAANDVRQQVRHKIVRHASELDARPRLSRHHRLGRQGTRHPRGVRRLVGERRIEAPIRLRCHRQCRSRRRRRHWRADAQRRIRRRHGCHGRRCIKLSLACSRLVLLPGHAAHRCEGVNGLLLRHGGQHSLQVRDDAVLVEVAAGLLQRHCATLMARQLLGLARRPGSLRLLDSQAQRRRALRWPVLPVPFRHCHDVRSGIRAQVHRLAADLLEGLHLQGSQVRWQPRELQRPPSAINAKLPPKAPCLY
mmetsp:Transcript_130131/g.376481  ORF Transcript_130131/g.376481 Transcript_130131/m.376481 type:complete len:289 (+) Transcript_130131:275-1141(+)